MKKRLLYIVGFWMLSFPTFSKNLLDTSTWTIGSGSVSGFSQNGSTSENIREFGSGPQGSNVLLWKAVPDASSNGGDGGWNTDYHNIDHLKSYRFTVWLKKTNSNSGNSYLGCSSPNNIAFLDDNLNNNPYFWQGDLPSLNKWYLVVGYVHSSKYNKLTHYGGIYDGETGEKVRNITDYKFIGSSSIVRHRAYLGYDGNTSDRQYFYDPRIDLVDGNEPSIESLLDLTNSSNTNLLNTSSWTVGSGSVSGYSQHGLSSENTREYYRNHIGEEKIVWKASPNSSGGSSGGLNSNFFNINNLKSHRFSIWLKKTNSNDGSTLYGCLSNQNGISNLNGSIQGSPYFLIGDLPKLNRWYLLVGYVHHKNYNSSTSIGGIYDGTTGEKVRSLTDFKFNSTALNVRLHSYLHNDSNTLDRQYFYSPRIDPINGNEPTIHQLLKINDNSKLIFTFDSANNQSQNFYCADPTYCAPPAAKKQEK